MSHQSAIEQIDRKKLTGTSATITFSSIPTKYSQLLLVYVVRSDFSTAGNQDSVVVQFNGDTASNYYDERFMVFGSSTQVVETLSASSAEIGQCPSLGATANQFGAGQLLIPEYASTSFTKTCFSSGAYMRTLGTVDIRILSNAQLWNSTAAINSIQLFVAGGSLVAGSVATLYGII